MADSHRANAEHRSYGMLRACAKERANAVNVIRGKLTGWVFLSARHRPVLDLVSVVFATGSPAQMPGRAAKHVAVPARVSDFVPWAWPLTVDDGAHIDVRRDYLFLDMEDAIALPVVAEWPAEALVAVILDRDIVHECCGCAARR